MKVTIITVCKNAEELIRKTIDSVLSQTYTDVEYIVIDGASSDGTVGIVTEYAEKYPIRWISEPDSGIYQAMNKGIAMATGEWIHFLHAGDVYLAENTLEKIANIDINNSDLLATPISLLEDSALKTWRPEYFAEKKHYYFPHTGIFIKNEFYRRYGGYRENYKIISDGLYYSDNFHAAKIYIAADIDPTVVMHVGLSGRLSFRYIYENILNILYYHEFPIDYRAFLIRDFISGLLGRFLGKRKIKYYSQYGQDKFLDEYIFKKKKDGIFLDIGANDGICFSNTYFFEKERGWDGFCVEPAPASYEKLKKNRSCQSFKLAISSESKKALFRTVLGEANMLSVLKEYCSEDHSERIKKETDASKEESEDIFVECCEVNEFFGKINSNYFDYLSIDVEGGEYDIVKAIDFNKVTIKVISVEANANKYDVQKILLQKGYVLIRIIGCDEMYVKSRLCYKMREMLSSLVRRRGIYGKMLSIFARMLWVFW